MKSSYLFFLGCIPVRLFLAYLAYYAHKHNNKSLMLLMMIITFFIGMGFLSIYFMGWRKTGFEVDDKKIWWNSLRPIHGTIYLLSFLLLITRNSKYVKYVWPLLLLDVLIGISAEIAHLYRIY